MIAIIGGTLFTETPFFASAVPEMHQNHYGKAIFMKSGNTYFVNRHGISHDVPAHKINHAANMTLLASLGVKTVIGAYSVGSLKADIHPGTIMIPDDYINLWLTSNVFDETVKHITPKLSDALRIKLIEEGRKIDPEILDKGVYYQTRGPRLETKAEVKMISSFADVVGMTMGQEATAAQEAGLEFAALCSIDNYANGITEKDISEAEIRRLAKVNSDKVKEIIISVAFLSENAAEY